MSRPDLPASAAPPPRPPPGLRLPLTRPRWVWLLFGINIAVWLLMTAAGGSENQQVLTDFGANVPSLIVQGQVWRLFTANFLHIGLPHLLFNMYAIYVLGPEMEALYGSPRFLTIYLLSGLSGSIASFALNTGLGLSAGASTSLFGIIGAMIAFYARNRERFGGRGRQRLNSYLTLAGLNLIISISIPSIDMLGHAGGFAGGLILGWLLSPYYTVRVEADGPRVIDLNSLRGEWRGVALFVLLLIVGVIGGISRQGSV